jgi:hypothetical protein
VVVIETAGQGAIIDNKSNDIFLKLKPLNNENKEFVLTMVSDNNELVDKRNSYTTNAEGNFRYTIDPDRNYIVLVENPKYENFKEKFSGTKLFSTNEHCFPITKKNCLVLDGTVINEAYNSRIPNANFSYLINVLEKRQKRYQMKTGSLISV